MAGMNRSGLTALLLVLSFLGLADAWYLTQSALTGTALSCDIGAALDGCNIVAQSPYSKLFGLPLALYGVGFYALVFALTASLFVWHARALYRFAVWLGIVGVLMSAVFLAIQFFLIKALCIYCLASAAITLFIWVASRSLWKRFAPSPVVVEVPL